jgi:transcriptional regulator with XRE-family HTH domain
MRAARQDAGFALCEVASRMGISTMTLSRLERSNRTTEDQARQFLAAITGG